MRKLLKKARTNKELSPREVAEKIGITERMYRYIEAGTRIGSFEIWDNLEDLFGIPQRQLRIQEKGCANSPNPAQKG